MNSRQQRSTIKEVAKAAHVSVSTASIALNHKKGVSPKTMERVTAAAKELNYHVNRSAKALRSYSSQVIGIIVPEVINIYYGTMIEYVREYVESKGYFLIIGITDNKLSNEKRYIREFISRNVDGIIIVPMLKYSNEVAHLKEVQSYGIPIVSLSAAYAGLETPCIMCNLSKGMYELTKYMLDRGIRRIALVAGDKRVDNDYIHGFKAAFEEKGIGIDDSLIFESDISFEGALSKSKEILDLHPEAVMTISDLMACGIVQAAKNRGLNIPGDISITGYDDVIYASINQTPITTVHQPIREMCKRAVDVIVDWIEGAEAIPSVELLAPVVVYRDTTV